MGKRAVAGVAIVAVVVYEGGSHWGVVVEGGSHLGAWSLRVAVTVAWSLKVAVTRGVVAEGGSH